MTTLLLPLSGDVETHGSVFGGGAAYLAIDEDPSDGDTTRIRIINAGEVEASSIDDSALPGEIVVSTVRVLWDAAGTNVIGDPSFGRAGLRIGGVNFWANARELSPNVYGGTTEEEWTTNPATGLPWSRQAVGALIPIWETTYQPFDVGYPRLTQRVLEVDYEPIPLRQGAAGETLGPAAHISGAGPAAGGASVAPSSGGEALGPEAGASGGSHEAAGSTSAQGASGASQGPRAGTSIVGCSAAASAAPLKAHPSSLAMEAIPSNPDPDSGGAS